MTIGNLGTGITLSSLASEWGQPATNVKLGDYTADRSTRNDDLYIQVQKRTWSDTGPYQAITGNTTSGAPAVNRDYFLYNLTQLEMGVTWGDSLSDATGTYNAPDGRHIFSSFGGSSLVVGENPPFAYNINHANTVNGNTRKNMFWVNDSDTMHEFRDGQGPFRDMDVKRFVHPVQNQATGGNLAYTYINITNNPKLKRGIGSAPYDSSGIKTKNISIIQNGKFKNLELWKNETLKNGKMEKFRFLEMKN